jgi:hypothetical protein
MQRLLINWKQSSVCQTVWTAGILKLSPQWDELRGEPRFQRVVVEVAKPVKID